MSTDGSLLSFPLALLALKSTVILAAAFGLDSMLRKARAALRHLVWVAAFSGLLALPLLSSALPDWHAAFLPAGRLVPFGSPIILQSAEQAGRVEQRTLSIVDDPRPPTGPKSWLQRRTWGALASLVWQIGAAVICVQTGLAFLAVHALRRRSAAIADGTCQVLFDECLRAKGLRPRAVQPANRPRITQHADYLGRDPASDPATLRRNLRGQRAA